MVARADDHRIGIKTAAVTFGRFDVAAVALCYAATLALLAWVGTRLAVGVFFHAGLVAAAGIAVYHLQLIRDRAPAQCFRAFLHNTWFGAVVFAGIALDRLA
jgi:4-hydroxybenzoate polyprenyltransferase